MDRRELQREPEQHEVENDPLYLYRYRPMNCWAEGIFARSELYFPSPRQFNDPFDCRVPSFRTVSKTEFTEFLKGAIAKNAGALTCNERRKKAHDLYKEKPFVQRVDELRNFLQGQVNKLGILSLSEVPDDILMWAHYASSHTGFCLKFEASKYAPFFGYAQRVNYADEYQPIVRLGDNYAMVDRIVLTKSSHWSYEREWRIINHDSGPGVRKFPPDLLVGVIFGCQMKKKDREQVRAWTCGRSNPRFYQTLIREGTFALEIREV
jgi:Protein of unknown function (DUF2971)